MAWLITQLENMAFTLAELLENGTLTLTVGGEEYLAANDSFHASGDFSCALGEQSAGVFCGTLPNAVIWLPS